MIKMNDEILELDQKDIELELREIQLKRKLNQIAREKILTATSKEEHSSKLVENCNLSEAMPVSRQLYLHYSKSAMASIPRIADVCPDGSIKIYAKYDTPIITKKYSMNSLIWIRGNLPKWSDKQKETTGFFKLLARKYSTRFVKISHSTMESLCYLVDSGNVDPWFEKYGELKRGKQSTLKI